MTRAALGAAVRAWLVAAGASGGVPNADRSVIYADQSGDGTVKPPVPFLTVRVLSYDVPVHEDQSLYNDASPPVWRSRGNRTATVSVNAYGAGGEDWLVRAVGFLRAPSIRAQFTTAGVAVRAVGGLDNLSELLDDKTQVRVHRDFAVDYEQTSETEAVVELTTVVHEDNYDSTTATDRVETVTVVLP